MYTFSLPKGARQKKPQGPQTKQQTGGLFNLNLGKKNKVTKFQNFLRQIHRVLGSMKTLKM